MAKVVSRSGLASKLGTAGAKAVKEHREDETRMGFVNLPGGIKHGIAKLIDCRFSQYKTGEQEGEYFWLAAGAVLKPEVHEGVPVKGLRTQIMIPLVEAKIRSGKRAGETITVDERLAEVLNEMRKLGYDTSSLEVTDLEAACEELKELEPAFRFSTRSSMYTPPKTKVNPKPETKEFINESWHGAVDFDGDITSSEVVDETEEVESLPDDEAVADAEEGEELDLEALGTAADADDEEAQAALTEQAEAAGLDPNEYELWAELAAVLSEADTAEVQEDEEEVVEEEPEPAVGECWKYTPKKANPKKTAYDFEITAVFKAKKTVNGKNLDKKSEVVRSVPWSELSST